MDTGLYLTHEVLGQSREAEEAFARIVQDGIKQDRLAVKFLFNESTCPLIPSCKPADAAEPKNST